MAEVVKVRGYTIGEGTPGIIVPIVGETREEILEEASHLKGLPADMVEWRADFFQEADDNGSVRQMLAELRRALGETPLLFTFRTKREGGQRGISGHAYVALNALAAQSGVADLVDVEIFGDESMAAECLDAVHRAGVPAVGSNHDFHGTPSREEIVRRLRRMQEMEADILKIAVMPQNARDVLALLEATAEMRESYADRPLITMSMAGKGVVSRLAGEVFGSAMTFGAAGKVSAPGQIPVNQLKEILHLLHESLK